MSTFLFGNAVTLNRTLFTCKDILFLFNFSFRIDLALKFSTFFEVIQEFTNFYTIEQSFFRNEFVDRL